MKVKKISIADIEADLSAPSSGDRAGKASAAAQTEPGPDQQAKPAAQTGGPAAAALTSKDAPPPPPRAANTNPPAPIATPAVAPPPPAEPQDEVEKARLAAKRMAKTAAKFKAKAEDKARAAAEAEATARAVAMQQSQGAASPGTAVAIPPAPTLPAEAPQPGLPAPQAPQASAPPPPQAEPEVEFVRFRFRHALLVLSFLVMVVCPILISGWYLWTRAADQYASYAGFTVRSEEATPSIGALLGPLGGLGGSTTPDADILYEFIQSQDMVARVDDKLDLEAIWSKADPRIDPYFAFHPPGTVEDLRSHWARKVKVVYDSASGLIELRVLAYDPTDAQAIAAAILDESTALINDLSVAAREDAVGYARVELEKAQDNLKAARRIMTEFRNANQIVDPEIDIQAQATILGGLQSQLAEALIELDLVGNVRANDPRITRLERRIEAIEARIGEEKAKFGISGADGSAGTAFASLVGDFEVLMVEREFAEEAYAAARIAFDSAQGEAARQTRYLAVHVRPSQAERSEYPKRLTLLGFVALFAFLLWAVFALIAYSIRDRR